MPQEIFFDAIPRQVVDYYSLYGFDEEKVKQLYGPVRRRCCTPAARREEQSAPAVDREIQVPCPGAAEGPSQSSSAPQDLVDEVREEPVPEEPGELEQLQEPGEPEQAAKVPAANNAGPWATGDGAVEAAAEG